MFVIRLKEIMQERDLSQNKLAQMTGIHEATIRTYYHGTVQRPDLGVLETLCDTLGVGVEEMIVKRHGYMVTKPD